MASNTPQPGSVLAGKYRLLHVLGKGGMGTVFEAEHTLTNKHVALKWMHMRSSSDPEAAQRFVREAQASARLRHPNVVDVYDVECLEDEAFMVMELLEGEPLTRLLARRDRSLQSVLELLLPAMAAVAKAHESGVIHRDIKPDNIFLARHDGRDTPVPKVLDFGISKVMGTETLSMTRAGAAMGTPQYMSLEQLYGQRDVDGRTDVYAFGVILYEAATGKLPYDADSITELAVKIATTDPPHPRTLRPDLPGGLCDVIMRSMAKDRDERYANMGALIDAIGPYASGQVDTLTAGALVPVSSQPSHSVTPISQPAAVSLSLERARADAELTADPAKAFRRKHRTRILALGALMASLVLFGVALFIRLPWDREPAAEPGDATPADKQAKDRTPEVTVLEARGALPEGETPPEATDADGAKPNGGTGQMMNARVHAPHSIHAEAGKTQAEAAPAAKTTRNAVTMEPDKSPDQPDTQAVSQPAAQAPAPNAAKQQAPQAPVSILAGRSQALPSRAEPLLRRVETLAQRAPLQASQAPAPRRAAPRAAPRTHAWGKTTAPPSVPYRHITGLKAAYRAHKISRADYNTHVRSLKLWRKAEIRQAKLDYRNRVIDKRAYQLRVQAIDRAYSGG